MFLIPYNIDKERIWRIYRIVIFKLIYIKG